MEFYGAAAQVIPVLLLAIIFENRELVRRPSSYDPEEHANPLYWNATGIVYRVYAALIIAGAEVAALIGLYAERTDRLTNGLVWLGLMTALTSLVGSVVSRQWGYWRAWWATEAKRTWWFVAIFAALLAMFTRGFLGFFH